MSVALTVTRTLALLPPTQSIESRTALTFCAGMAGVIAKYPSYRYAALGLGLLAIVAVALTRRGWVVGAAAGVLVLLVAQLAIDHYSEARATRYAEQLGAARATLP